MKLWSIGGCKGGVGKSIFTVALGITLARQGCQVILVDGDLGGANLHTMMGISTPEVALEDFLLQKVPKLADTVLPTDIDGVRLICGVDDRFGAANPTYFQKTRLFKELATLPADFILIDLGAGTSINTLDLFNHSPGRIAVTTGVMTSLKNVYGFIKCALFRRIAREFAKEDEVLSLIFPKSGAGSKEEASISDLIVKVRRKAPKKVFRLVRTIRTYRTFLVPNMVKNEQDMRSPEIIQSVCQDILDLKPEVLGYVLYDPIVDTMINQMDPTILLEMNDETAKCYEKIANKVMEISNQTPRPTANGGKINNTVLLSRTHRANR